MKRKVSYSKHTHNPPVTKLQLVASILTAFYSQFYHGINLNTMLN